MVDYIYENSAPPPQDDDTKGLEDMIEGKYAIAFTHAPVTEDQKKKAKDKDKTTV